MFAAPQQKKMISLMGRNVEAQNRFSKGLFPTNPSA
jgi:hypothetical protein